MPSLFNRASLIQIATRIWSGFAGFVLIFLLGFCLNINEQGYFYTFQSLLSLQVFFEMGLGQVLLQVASHEFAKSPPSKFEQQIYLLTDVRLQSIIQYALRWFRNASFLFLVLALPAGIGYFSFFNDNATSAVVWLGPWILACLGQASLLLLLPFLVFREASGAIAEVALWRFISELVGYLALFIGLYFKLGLYALPLLFFGRALVVAGFVACSSEFVKALIKQAHCFTVKSDLWAREVMPFQRRMALSWLSGYLLFSSMPMLIFPILGAEASGRFGMTWAALLGAVSLSMALVSARIQGFCVLIAQGEFEALRSQYSHVAKGSFLLALLAVGALILALLISNFLGFALSDRFLPVSDVFLLGVVVSVNQIIFVQAALVRATKSEPYVLSSTIGGLVQLSLTVFATFIWGISGLVLLMAAWSMLVGLPWGLQIFNKYKPWASNQVGV